MGKEEPLKTTKLPPLIPKTTKAAEYHTKHFLPRAANSLDKLHKIPLTVFVCGPSDKTNPLTKKKVDVVNALRAHDYNALLGEEEVEELKQKDKQEGRPIRQDHVYERIIALASDVIVIFRSSFGSVAEFHELCSEPEIGMKTLVFTDKAHSKSYSSSGALKMHDSLFGKVEPYKSPTDIDNCTLLTKTMQYVQDWQAAKWLKEAGVPQW